MFALPNGNRIFLDLTGNTEQLSATEYLQVRGISVLIISRNAEASPGTMIRSIQVHYVSYPSVAAALCKDEGSLYRNRFGENWVKPTSLTYFDDGGRDTSA